jgi:hypothetical protein
MLLLFLSAPLVSAADTIPALIPDRHADHAAWFLGQAGTRGLALILLDAHADAAALLEEALAWFDAQEQFAAPDISLFRGGRIDGSAKAASFRAEGKAVPDLMKR